MILLDLLRVRPNHIAEDQYLSHSTPMGGDEHGLALSTLLQTTCHSRYVDMYMQ